MAGTEIKLNKFLFYVDLIHITAARWCCCWRAHFECSIRRSWVRVPVGFNQRLGIFFFSAKPAALKSKRKDWLAQNQDNVSKWSNMSTRGLPDK
jgi:hypothetical protein